MSKNKAIKHAKQIKMNLKGIEYKFYFKIAKNYQNVFILYEQNDNDVVGISARVFVPI